MAETVYFFMEFINGTKLSEAVMQMIVSEALRPTCIEHKAFAIEASLKVNAGYPIMISVFTLSPSLNSFLNCP